MFEYNPRPLIIHGILVMLGGFIAGGFLGAVATGSLEGSLANWKLAHMEGLLNGLMLLAVAGISQHLCLSPGQGRWLTLSLLIMAYCNLGFGFLRGATGELGLDFSGTITNQVTTLLGTLGVPFAIIGVIIVLIGAIKKQN